MAARRHEGHRQSCSPPATGPTGGKSSHQQSFPPAAGPHKNSAPQRAQRLVQEFWMWSEGM
jgi:hypothetical protein